MLSMMLPLGDLDEDTVLVLLLVKPGQVEIGMLI
jgi:hypothetical protein